MLMIIVPAKQMSEIWSLWNYELMGPTLLAYSKVGATSIPLKVHAKMEICMLALTQQGFANAWVRQTCSLKEDMKG